uniref:Immunoglobulin superfamily member 10 n=1 Tax=Amazona collaria TaxID=241587 RepID=A0A8B9FZY8_9PSIT
FMCQAQVLNRRDFDMLRWCPLASVGTDAPDSRGNSRWMVFANGTLSITQVDLEDRGQYLCTAANPHGAARLLVTLSVVAYPPRITGSRWQLLTAHSGKPVTMKCKAEGRPSPTVSWVLANKTYISDSLAGNNKVHVETDGTLIIKEVTVYDRGLYTCMAKNPAGTDKLIVKLQVIAAPPAILEEKRERVEVMMGENLKLPCTVEGNPQPTVHWLLNAKLFLFSNGTLYLSSITSSDSGNYECIATSSTGSERRVVSLMVQHRDTLPKIATASEEMTHLNFGDKLLLNCTATGEPKPRIIWRLPSKAVVDLHFLHANGSLSVHQVKLLDAGEYMCVARNPGGDDTKLYKLDVVAKPPVINGLYANKTIMKVTAFILFLRDRIMSGQRGQNTCNSAFPLKSANVKLQKPVHPMEALTLSLQPQLVHTKVPLTSRVYNEPPLLLSST